MAISALFIFPNLAAAEQVVAESNIDKLRVALQNNPQSARVKQSLSQALTDQAKKLLQKKQTDQAVLNLKEAVSLAPQNGPAWFFLGDIAYLQQSDFRYALDCWNKAFPLAPSEIQKQITARISKAELDRHLEEGYSSIPSEHFDIRFPSGYSRKEAERLGAYLEGEFRKFSEELNVSPSQLTLIIYQKNTFDRLTGQHDETLGLYDGRIRIAAKEVGGKFEYIILSHELAHAFLQHAFGNDLPIWIQEGYAQSREPERIMTSDEKRLESELREGSGWIPLKWLDRKFSQPGNLEDVSRSYLESRLVVGYLLKLSKGRAFQLFVGRIAHGQSLKEAFEAEFHGQNWNSVEYCHFQG